METDILNLGSLTYGLLFLTVLAEYIGVPVPSSVVLVLSGAGASQGRLSPLIILLLAQVAATLGDILWFIVGRIKGEMFVRGYCKLSLGSRDCVRRTKDLFLHYPRTSLLLGKFVPGLSTFVVPVAGFSGTSYAEFLRYDSGGIFLWASTMIAIGYGAGEWIGNYTNSVKFPNGLLLTIVATALVCFYGIKLWRLKKFGRAELVEAQ